MKKEFITIFFAFSFFSFGLSQQHITYETSDEIFFNPERGFYTQLTTYNTQSPLTLSSLNLIKNQGQSLILRLYYLTNFKNTLLSQDMLNMISNDLSLVRQAGIKVILRFAYSDNIGQSDAPLNIILSHIDQLKPILQQNSDVIFLMQAGFIGAWGEWHSSTNGLDNTESRRQILFKILDALPNNRMVQVRTPKFKKEIFENYNPIPPDSAFMGTYFTRTGHHNDAFLSSWDDMGTYEDTIIDKQYLGDDCLFVPMGGETSNPSPFSSCGNAIYQMKKLRWTYLNSQYHPDVLSNWISSGCFDEINRYLGYRFELINGSYTQSLKPGDTFEFNLKIVNKGFAPLYNPRKVELVLINNTTGQKFICLLPDDPRNWKPGDTIVLNYQIGLLRSHPPGIYELFINLPDPDERLHDNPSYSIRVANLNLWDAEKGYNKLNFSLTVDTYSSGVLYSGNLFFLPYFNLIPKPKKELYIPENLDIVNVSVTNDDSLIYFNFIVRGGVIDTSNYFYHILINTDNNNSTGFHWLGVGVGAEYMFENGYLWKYTGINNSWNWQYVDALDNQNYFTIISNNIIQFIVKRAIIDDPPIIDFSFNISNSNVSFDFAPDDSTSFYRYQGTLPVEISNFYAFFSKNKIVELYWSTATEVNNYGFEVQRKFNGDWNNIGFVAGKGNSNSINYYKFIDYNITKDGLYEYRLRQIDIDGSYTFSNIVQVDVNLDNDKVSMDIYPNPFNPVANIVFMLPKLSRTNLIIYDISGKKVCELLKDEIMEKGIYRIKFDAKNYSSGVYLVELKIENERIIKKLCLKK